MKWKRKKQTCRYFSFHFIPTSNSFSNEMNGSKYIHKQKKIFLSSHEMVGLVESIRMTKKQEHYCALTANSIKKMKREQIHKICYTIIVSQREKQYEEADWKKQILLFLFLLFVHTAKSKHHFLKYKMFLFLKENNTFFRSCLTWFLSTLQHRLHWHWISISQQPKGKWKNKIMVNRTMEMLWKVYVHFF